MRPTGRDGLPQDSPCIGVCTTTYTIDPEDRCRACGRRAKHCDGWLMMSEAQKSAVWDEVIELGWKPEIGVYDV